MPYISKRMKTGSTNTIFPYLAAMLNEALWNGVMYQSIRVKTDLLGYVNHIKMVSIDGVLGAHTKTIM